MVDQWEKVKVKKQRNWNYVGELSPYFLQFMINTGRMKTKNKRTANSLIDWISLLFPWSCYVFFLIKVNPVGIEWVLVWATNCLIPVCGDKIQGRRGNKVRIDNSIRHKTSISTPVSLQASLHPIYVLPKMDIGDKSPQLNILSYTLQFWFCEILCWRLFLRKGRSCLRCRWLPSWTGVYWKPSSAQVWNYSLYSFLGILCPFSNPLIFLCWFTPEPIDWEASCIEDCPHWHWQETSLKSNFSQRGCLKEGALFISILFLIVVLPRQQS